MNDKASAINPAAITPSTALAAAAMAGLLGLGASACGSLPLSKDKKDDQAATTNMAESPAVTAKKNVPDMSFALFAEQCKGRSGLVETHAACGGAGSCKGMSFNKYSKDLIEHTCKGGNTCAGMSCVDTPADTNLGGEALYQKVCSGCHTGMTGDQADGTKFKVFYPKGGDATKVETDFRNRSVAAQVSIVAFGTHGTNPSGSAYANMPAYYTKYSRAEIERVVTYLRTLTPSVSEYEILGEP